MNPAFKHFSHPTIKETGPIPIDLELELPETANQLPQEMHHFLLSIPWQEKFTHNIPNDLRPFFSHALPHLHVRTTDVHTAICLGFLEEAIAAYPSIPINRRVLGISLILHDCGWSKLSQNEIAQSLGVTGLSLSTAAIPSKEKHAIEGQKIARSLLDTSTFNPPLTDEDVTTILLSVRYHDQPELVASKGNLPIEVKLLVDLDHLWSFTKKNFWQDTIRKGVTPREYLANLTNDLPKYFVTDWGKAKAEELLQERSQEVSLLNQS